MRKLAELAARKKRHVVGLMSGTSADAVDAVLVELSGHGADTHFAVCSFSTLPLPDLLRAEVLALCAGGAGIDDLYQANFALGAFFAEAALHVIAEAGLKPEEVDLIGSHGQTVCHLPNGKPASTLQIGEAAVSTLWQSRSRARVAQYWRYCQCDYIARCGPSRRGARIRYGARQYASRCGGRTFYKRTRAF